MIQKLASAIRITIANAVPATSGMAPIAGKASSQAVNAVPMIAGFVCAMIASPLNHRAALSFRVRRLLRLTVLLPQRHKIKKTHF